MEIVVEAVLLDNFCLDVFLSYAAILLTKKKVKLFRIVLSALLGSGFALLSPIIVKFSIAYKLCVLFVCSAVLYGKGSFRGYAVFTFVYALVNFCFAGLLSFFLGGTLKTTFIGIGKGGVIAIVSASCFCFLYAVRQISGLIKERKRKDLSARVKLVFDQKTIELSALFDSGNLLTDEKGESVILVDGTSLGEVKDLKTIGSILVRTASGSKTLSLIEIPAIEIYSEGTENTFINVKAALSDLPKEYSVILPYK